MSGRALLTARLPLAVNSKALPYKPTPNQKREPDRPQWKSGNKNQKKQKLVQKKLFDLRKNPPKKTFVNYTDDLDRIFEDNDDGEDGISGLFQDLGIDEDTLNRDVDERDTDKFETVLDSVTKKLKVVAVNDKGQIKPLIHPKQEIKQESNQQRDIIPPIPNAPRIQNPLVPIQPLPSYGPLPPDAPNPVTGIYESRESIKNRRPLEMRNFMNENVYDFSDIKMFQRHRHDPELSSACDPVIFYLLHSSWSFNDNDGTVLEFGGNVEGTNASIHVKVTDFLPSFYMKKPPGWGDIFIKEFLQELNQVAFRQYRWNSYERKTLEKFSRLFLNYEVVKQSELKDYNDTRSTDMIKVQCSWPNAVGVARAILNSPEEYDWRFNNKKFNIYEADVDFTQRFFLDTGNLPCRWYTIPSWAYQFVRNGSSSSTADVQIKCKYTDMKMRTDGEYNKKLPDWKIVSFDTEWKNIPRRFVDKDEDPIIVITMSIYKRSNPDDKESVLMVYAADGKLPDDLPKTDHFYWYRSEPGLLDGFKKFIDTKDPDFFVDYNGAGFDWPYICDAGVAYFGDGYSCLGRDKYKKAKFLANEWRNKTLHSAEIPERILVDMLKMVRGGITLLDFHFNNFALGTVSQVMLGETKVEFDVNLMDQKWRNPETIGEIWTYGEKDAVLPGNLCNKLNVINTFISVSQLTSLTLQKAINRGTGSKIDGFLRKLSADKAGADRILFECLNKKIKNHNIIDTCAKDVIGASVMKPRRGYYDEYVIVLDFNSMYPSIIIALNLCLSTFISQYVKQHNLVDFTKYWTLPTYVYDDGEVTFNASPFNASFIKRGVITGLLPEAEEKLWKWRKSVKDEIGEIEKIIESHKKLIKEHKAKVEELKKINANDPNIKLEILKLEKIISDLAFEICVLNGLQAAIKIIMNGIFGQTIFEESRFYKREIGSTILQFGRYMINYVRLYVVNFFNLKRGYAFDTSVIYGDTDSVMVTFINCIQKLTYKDVFNFGKHAETEINKLFEAPIKIEFEKIYYPYLLISAKNYIGRKFKSIYKDTEFVIDAKGVKHKKTGTSPNAQKLGKNLENDVFMLRDIPAALKRVRDNILALKTRKTTRSELVISINIGKDLAPALYHYMLKQRDAGNYPPEECEKLIREKYASLPYSLKQKKANAGPQVVYAYRQLCRDTKAWIARGMSINFIYIDTIEEQKREQVCDVGECIANDWAYNAEYYIQEVLRVSRKILGFVVGDVDPELKLTPEFDKLTIYHPDLISVAISQHVSFFDSQYGCKTLKLNDTNALELTETCDDETANKIIKRIVQMHDGEDKFAKAKKINQFFSYSFKKCPLCIGPIDQSDKTVCTKCVQKYPELYDREVEKHAATKQSMNTAWDKCRSCLKSDKLDAMDCINTSCDNFTRRTDHTKDYYKEYRKLESLKNDPVLTTILRHRGELKKQQEQAARLAEERMEIETKQEEEEEGEEEGESSQHDISDIESLF